MTSYERTNWRDQELSNRHRIWEFNCPCVDLDFIAVEYNIGKPVLIVDYKHFMARKPDLKHPSYRAVTLLADGYGEGPLPFLIVTYWPDIWAFSVFPVNECARGHFHENEQLTEKEYVAHLYRLRSMVLTKGIIPKLNDALPMEEGVLV